MQRVKNIGPLKLLLPILAVLAVAGMFAVRPAGAQEIGQAFSISPPLLDLKANPGQTVTAKIKLTNVSASDLVIKTQLNDFAAKNESGEPNIIFDDSNSGHSLKQWIKSPDPFSLGSKQTKTIEVPITVPANAEPGGHYAVIRFTGSAPEAEKSGVALSASIGSLVLLQVSGDIKQSASLLEFFSADSNGKQLAFFENGPIMFSARVKNDGNVHLKPTGTIEIYNGLGQKIDTLRLNGDPQNTQDSPKSVLPNSIRRFDQTWKKDWGFGRYEAKLNLSYGDNNLKSEANYVFWIIPYKVIILGLAAAAGLFFGLRFAIRRYNQRIINKAIGGSNSGLKLRK